MNDIILFSPVGGTDPISMNNNKDGSMLHICRVYKPTKIILYMSQEVLDSQKADDRYRYALRKLFEYQGRKDVEIVEIERPELKNVQEFDYFYRDFREIITEIFANMDETDKLLINVSSGTPAMKSGLLVLQTLGEFPATMIQVVTPLGKMNEHSNKNYNIIALWDKNKDNLKDFENRCKPVECPTLSKIKNEEIIKKHIMVYDYQAAIAVAEMMREEDTEKYIGLLKMAAARILLDFSAVDKWQEILKTNILPVQSENGRKYFEYALNLSIKLKRKEYADFIRGLTPIIVDLFKLALQKECNIDIHSYTKKKKGVEHWDPNKLDHTIKGIFEKHYNREFKYGPVYSAHLKILLLRFSRNSQLKNLTENLRIIEENIRNIAAHEIVSITDRKIKKLTEFTGNQIMDMLIDYFSFTGLEIAADSWKSYDNLNEMIVAAMEVGN